MIQRHRYAQCIFRCETHSLSGEKSIVQDIQVRQSSALHIVFCDVRKLITQNEFSS